MHETILRAAPFASNHKGLDKEAVYLIQYDRPSIKTAVGDTSSGKSLSAKFDSTLGKFTALASIGNHAQGGLDWVTSGNTIPKVEVLRMHIINGAPVILSKDTYINVTLQMWCFIFEDIYDYDNIPVKVYMEFTASDFQLVNVGFQHNTKSGASEKGRIKQSNRTAKS